MRIEYDVTCNQGDDSDRRHTSNTDYKYFLSSNNESECQENNFNFIQKA